MKEESLLLLSDLQKLINQVVLIDYTIIILEGERLLKNIKDDSYVFCLAIDGKQLDSVELSQKMDKLMTGGKSHLVFVPHQLMRVILLEQIYRSFRISNNEPYHK